MNFARLIDVRYFFILLLITAFINPLAHAEGPTYYQILDVPQNSSEQEIKAAFRRLAIKYHPDRNAGDILAAAKFIEIRKAYDTLSDRTKRVAYDRALNNYQTNSFGIARTLETREEYFEQVRKAYPLLFDQNFNFEDPVSYRKIGHILFASKEMTYQLLMDAPYLSKKAAISAYEMMFNEIVTELKYFEQNALKTKNSLMSYEDIKTERLLFDSSLSSPTAFRIALSLKRPFVEQILKIYFDSIATAGELHHGDPASMTAYDGIARALDDPYIQDSVFQKIILNFKRADLTPDGEDRLVQILINTSADVLFRYLPEVLVILPTLVDRTSARYQKKYNTRLWETLIKKCRTDLERIMVLEGLFFDRKNGIDDYKIKALLEQISPRTDEARLFLNRVYSEHIESPDAEKRTLSLSAGISLLTTEPSNTELARTLFNSTKFPNRSFSSDSLTKLFEMTSKSEAAKNKVMSILTDLEMKIIVSLIISKLQEKQQFPVEVLDILETRYVAGKANEDPYSFKVTLEKIKTIRLQQKNVGVQPSCSSLFK